MPIVHAPLPSGGTVPATRGSAPRSVGGTAVLRLAERTDPDPGERRPTAVLTDVRIAQTAPRLAGGVDLVAGGVIRSTPPATSRRA